MNMFFQLTLGWFYGHVFEYFAHKYILHDRKRFKRIFKNHFKTHHSISRKNNMCDKNYNKIISSKFELISLLVINFLHFPIILIFPYFYAILVWSTFSYYLFHRLSHIHTVWGKKWMPWHYAHHMGKNQHMNWGVRLPIIDILLNTNKL